MPVIFVSEKDAIHIDIGVEDALKLILSGGLVKMNELKVVK